MTRRILLVAHPRRPLVALTWAHPDGDEVWIVDVDAGRTVASAVVPAGRALDATFEVEGEALRLDGGWLAVRPGRGDAPR